MMAVRPSRTVLRTGSGRQADLTIARAGPAGDRARAPVIRFASGSGDERNGHTRTDGAPGRPVPISGAATTRLLADD
jgi:hypothetical protein